MTISVFRRHPVVATLVALVALAAVVFLVALLVLVTGHTTTHTSGPRPSVTHSGI
jgi:hypothetical protein